MGALSRHWSPTQVALAPSGLADTFDHHHVASESPAAGAIHTSEHPSQLGLQV